MNAVAVGFCTAGSELESVLPYGSEEIPPTEFADHGSAQINPVLHMPYCTDGTGLQGQPADRCAMGEGWVRYGVRQVYRKGRETCSPSETVRTVL